MAQNTKIEWCDHTANLWHGCTKVHAGCDNCYAEKLSRRWGNDIWGSDKPRKEIKSVWHDLNKYQKLAAKDGVKKTVFIGSMMDIFEKPMPVINSNGEFEIDCHCDVCDGEFTTEHMRQWLFNKIIPNSPNLVFLLLTKRPSNINKYIPEHWKESPPKNVWFGTSISDEETAATLIPQLLKVNGNRFLSVEPQISEIDFYKVSDMWPSDNNHPWRGGPILQGIHWVIQGGESGNGKRPFDIEWAKLMMYQCIVCAKVPYFFKQIDKKQAIPDDLQIRQFPIF